jgi:hypothetical protein
MSQQAPPVGFAATLPKDGEGRRALDHFPFSARPVTTAPAPYFPRKPSITVSLFNALRSSPAKKSSAAPWAGTKSVRPAPISR